MGRSYKRHAITAMRTELR